jgi:RHS repeat-associated protein
LYTGRERDEETGLQYNRARYYDPTTGRFISEDPINFRAGDTNLSRYVLNSPTLLTDPSGRNPFEDVINGGINLVDHALYNQGIDLYKVVNSADQLIGGFASGASFGLSDAARQSIYGCGVNDNQHGLLHNIGLGLGIGASIGVGVGAPGNFVRGALLAERFAQGYTATGALVGSYESTRHIIEGRATPWDALAFLPAAGYLGGRVLPQLNQLSNILREEGGIANRLIPGKLPTKEAKQLAAYIEQLAKTKVYFRSPIAMKAGNHFNPHSNEIHVVNKVNQLPRGMFMEEVQHALDDFIDMERNISSNFGVEGSDAANKLLNAGTFERMAENPKFNLTPQEQQNLLEQASIWRSASKTN